MTTPTLDRRLFLAGLAAAPMVVSCGGQQHSAPGTPASTVPGDKWTRVRAQFALSPDWVHMAGFQLASHPTRVREVIERYRRALDENPALCVEEHAYDPAPMLNPAAAYLARISHRAVRRAEAI